MSRIDDIEQQIRQLTPDELATLRDWFLQFDAESWDRQIESDNRKGDSSEI